MLEAADGAAALEIVRSRRIDVALLDVRMPGEPGPAVLPRILDLSESIAVILMTAVPHVRTAVDAIKAGAYDYVIKPFDARRDSAPRAPGGPAPAARARGALSALGVRPGARLRRAGGAPRAHGAAVRADRAGRPDARDRADHRGERHRQGAGRARDPPPEPAPRPAVRRREPRGDPRHACSNPSCSATRRARSPARTRGRPGKFELAHGGTLFLDEVGSLRIDLQAKLLRALQEREVERLGGVRTTPVDVRVIAATNIDLRQAVRARAFREDLFYRLNVVPLGCASAARAEGGHPGPRRPLREEVLARVQEGRARALARGAPSARGVRLARQRARAGEHRRAQRGAGHAPRHPPRGPAARSRHARTRADPERGGARGPALAEGGARALRAGVRAARAGARGLEPEPRRPDARGSPQYAHRPARRVGHPPAGTGASPGRAWSAGRCLLALRWREASPPERAPSASGPLRADSPLDRGRPLGRLFLGAPRARPASPTSPGSGRAPGMAGRRARPHHARSEASRNQGHREARDGRRHGHLGDGRAGRGRHQRDDVQLQPARGRQWKARWSSSTKR